jgi:hypothetical protein
MKMTSHLYLVLKSRMMELNLHSTIHLHGMVQLYLLLKGYEWPASCSSCFIIQERAPVSNAWEAGRALKVGLDVMAEGKILSLPEIEHRLSGS